MVETLRDIGTLVAVLAGAPVAVAAALRLPTIGRPVRYLARVLISDPLSTAMEPMIIRAVEESSVLREIDRAVNTRDPSDPTISDDMVAVREQVGEITVRMRRGDARFDRLEERIEEVAEAICSTS